MARLATYSTYFHNTQLLVHTKLGEIGPLEPVSKNFEENIKNYPEYLPNFVIFFSAYYADDPVYELNLKFNKIGHY